MVSQLSLPETHTLEAIKIGKELVARCGSSPSALMLVRAAVAVGRALSIPVIAEGVEDRAQHQMLLDEGCLLFQGDYFQQPVPAADLARLVGNQLAGAAYDSH